MSAFEESVNATGNGSSPPSIIIHAKLAIIVSLASLAALLYLEYPT
ncbi:MAG: hypothetical protein ACFFA0_04015 [Promethearchaeota archaeon]